jgi:hypothetical protein
MKNIEKICPELKMFSTAEENVQNLMLSDSTKRLIECRAIFSDLCANVSNVIQHNYGYDTHILDDFLKLNIDLDCELSKIIGNLIHNNLLDSNFNSL